MCKSIVDLRSFHSLRMSATSCSEAMYASRALQCGVDVADAYADYYRWKVRPEFRDLCSRAINPGMSLRHCVKAPLWPRSTFAHEGEAVEPAPPSEISLKPHYGGSIVTSVVPSASTRVRTRHPLRTEKISGIIRHLLLLRHEFERPRLQPGLFCFGVLASWNRNLDDQTSFVGQSSISTPAPNILGEAAAGGNANKG
jgi:hypothetical protein